MGESFHNCDNCGEITSDYRGLYFCDNCCSVMCEECYDDFNYEKKLLVNEEEGYIIWCPRCDQFRHMKESYGD